MTAERARATETPDTLLTSQDVRAILRVGPNALTRYLPTIPHLRLGNPRTGPIRVRRSDLEAWIVPVQWSVSGRDDGQPHRMSLRPWLAALPAGRGRVVCGG